MNQDMKHLNVLELYKILEKLASEASLAEAKELALSLMPSADLEQVQQRLDETETAWLLMAKYGAPNFGGEKSVRNSLKRAETGGILSMRELLDIGEVLRVIRSLKEWRSNNQDDAQNCLDVYFSFLLPNKYFEDKIFTSIRSEEELFENASPALADLCRKIRNASGSIREKLERMVRSSASSKYLQENIITTRDGRYVIPVKIEHRGDVPGLVHDTSASGQTLFIEPAAIVEINNDLKILESKKQEEIDRILSELSVEAGSFALNILDSYSAVVSLNFAFAKAKLAYNMRAIRPQINNHGVIFLKNARHPLLDAKQVVPITVSLGEDFDTLVITGPNTGGKTVSLKTVGLFSLMAMCGLMLPCDDGSNVSVFDAVLADIGDEQSIEQSLSTFSAHMKNIISILERTKPGVLVLLDELGAGTDPIEGAALATSILMELRRLGAEIVATTHYAELKSYALDTDGVENGSCEFDVSSLKPTYKLLIGVPGRSNAFAISKRLGLDNRVVAQAQALVSEENKRFESVVTSLEQARQAAEAERIEAANIRAELKRRKQSDSEKYEAFQKEKAAILEEARTEAKRLVERTRTESNRILNELDDLRKAATKKDAGEMARRARAQAKSAMSKLEDRADPVDAPSADGDYRLPRPLKIGDLVSVDGIAKEATVLKIGSNGSDVMIQAGIFKTKVAIESVRLLDGKPKVTIQNKKVQQTVSKAAGRRVSEELDLRGQNAEEALLELDRFIDYAVLNKIETITIIHGKGTGVLRSKVQEHLRRHKNIQAFRLGAFGEGESGVTIAQIKS